MEHRLFPSILPDADDEFVDNRYTEGELEGMEYPELKSIAAEHPSDDVHGRMGKQELRNNLEGLERVNNE